MKVVYIAHPISGDVQGNAAKILQIVKNINLTCKDVCPFVPYLADVLSLDDNVVEQRERGIANDMHILNSGVVDELWYYGLSKGVQAEINAARILLIPVVNMYDQPEFFQL